MKTRSFKERERQEKFLVIKEYNTKKGNEGLKKRR